MKRIIVTTANNTCDPEEFGGTPQAMIDALRRIGISASGANLSPAGPLGLRRALWAAGRTISGSRPRGWQYSMTATRTRSHRLQRSGVTDKDTLVSLFQIPPSHPAKHLVFYLDGTLTMLRRGYSELQGISEKLMQHAIMREQQLYNDCRLVAVKTSLARKSLVDDYGVDPQKVRVIGPAPNLPCGREGVVLGDVPFQLGRRPETPLRMLCIAKDFTRKGVDKFVHVIRLLAERGVAVQGTVIGLPPDAVPVHYRDPRVTFIGYVPKMSVDFSAAADGHHFGLLLSNSEMAGLAMLEYQAMGLISIGSGVDGMPDTMITKYCYTTGLTGGDLVATADWISDAINSGEIRDMILGARESRNIVPTWTDRMRNLVSAIEEFDE